MTLKQIIAMADEIKPNAFSEETKTVWLNECEGLVQTEVLLLAPEEITEYTWDTDQNTALLVNPPHDKLYRAYLAAMIDFGNGEYNKYQNSMQMFNAHFTEFQRWYAMRYRPADRKVEPWKGHYFSAYGIAVKHGFVGSEEEWLKTLIGEKGDSVELRHADGVVQWRHMGTGENWQDLYSTDALKDEVVSATLKQAEIAASQAEQAKVDALNSANNAAGSATAAQTAAAAAAQARDDAKEALDAMKELAGSGDVFHITLTQNADGSISADKTGDEINEAYANKMAMYVSGKPLGEAIAGLSMYAHDGINAFYGFTSLVETRNVYCQIRITRDGNVNYITLRESEIGSGGADLTGYATEQWVRDGYQPKGDYAPASAIPTPTAGDEGKLLGVVDGSAAWVTVEGNGTGDTILIMDALATKVRTFSDAYSEQCNNEYVWILKDRPVLSGTGIVLSVRSRALSPNSGFSVLILKKNAQNNYTILQRKDYESKTNGQIDTIRYFAPEDVYIGFYSPVCGMSFNSSAAESGQLDRMDRALMSAFASGGGTATTAQTAAPLDFSYSLSVLKAAESQKPFVIVDKNGNGDYASITAAINGTREDAVIIINSGIYEEQIKMWGKKRHLVGVSRETCFIVSTSKYYNYEPLQANIGSVKNLTLIAGYGLTPVEGDTVSTSYALHIEYPNDTEYELVVEDCNIISNVAPAIGMGVRYNQTVRLKNCFIRTLCRQMYSSYYGSYFDCGAIFVHNDASAANLGTDAGLEVDGCELRGVLTEITLQSQNNGNTLDLRFTRNLVYSDEKGKDGTVHLRTPATQGHICGSDLILSGLSFGNNIDALNA